MLNIILSANIISFFFFRKKDELTSSDKEVYQKASPYVVPAYKQLCSILLVKSKLPPDEMVLTASETELLRIYRQDITDTIVSSPLFFEEVIK